jgi:Rrf2 family protein
MKTLSQRTKYALRALQVLAREEGKGPVLISELAERESIPKKFLESILLDLKNQGILDAKRGKGGGYYLRRSAEKIPLAQVIRALDGPIAPLPCASETSFRKCDECEDENTCGTRAIMKEVRDATAKILEQNSLADLVKRVDLLKENRRKGLMYYI